MKFFYQKPLYLFIALVLTIGIPLCIFPINLFPGVIEVTNESQQLSYDVPLSLSYFFGLGFNEGDLDSVSRFYLKPTGYALAFIVTIGLPALVSYRIYLKGKK